MNRPNVIALVAMLTTLLGGCYRPPEPAPGTSGSSAAIPAAVLPAGVDRAVVGIFSDPGNPCCWLGREASFETTVPANANHVTLTVFTPDDVPKLKRLRQHVTVAVEHHEQKFVNVPLGTRQLQVAVRQAAAPRTVLVTMHMGVTFTPQEELGSGDTRTLSIYLKSVRAW